MLNPLACWILMNPSQTNIDTAFEALRLQDLQSAFLGRSYWSILIGLIRSWSESRSNAGQNLRSTLGSKKRTWASDKLLWLSPAGKGDRDLLDVPTPTKPEILQRSTMSGIIAWAFHPSCSAPHTGKNLADWLNGSDSEISTNAWIIIVGNYLQSPLGLQGNWKMSNPGSSIR